MAGEEEWRRLMRRGMLVVVAVAVVCSWVGVARGDFASDQKECSESLIGLSTCLTYVEGSSKAPTPDCCTGLKQVVGKSPRCLCILIKDRNEPQLGLKIDVDRAVSLPAICSVPINISECIDLLKLPPNSKDAEIFKQYGNVTKAGNSSTGAPGSSGGRGSSSTTPSTAGGLAGKPSSGAVGMNHHLVIRGWRWVGVDMVGPLWASCALVLSLLIMGSG